jgi:hypothetical protein
VSEVVEAGGAREPGPPEQGLEAAAGDEVPPQGRTQARAEHEAIILPLTAPGLEPLFTDFNERR